jgi:signal peptidase II
VSPRFLGTLAALIGVLSDQAVKLWFLNVFDLARNGPIHVASFAEFRLAMNRGISYGLLKQDGALGVWGLFALAVLAAVALFIWMWRMRGLFPALALGLVIGGALGNAIDRAAYGAVVDYVHLFLPDRSFSWYIFNLADVWIVAGVIGLMYDSLIGPKDATKSEV